MTSTPNESNPTKIDKFTLITGVIGLIADIIGIFVFLFTFSNREGLKFDNTLLLNILLFWFLITYGWFLIGWFFYQQSKKKERLNDDVVFKIGGVGILMLPLSIAWITMILSNYMYVVFAILLGFAIALILELVVGFGILYAILGLSGNS